jgi:hypothetical protein
MVNLSRFFDTVEQSKQIFNDILGVARAAAIMEQIRHLHSDRGSTAARQYVSWPKLKELIETRTQLNFPVTAAELKERNEYASMLSASGVDIQTQARLPHRSNAASGSVPVTASGADYISIRTAVSNNNTRESSRSEHYRSIMSRLSGSSTSALQGAGATATADAGTRGVVDHSVASRVEVMMAEASAGVGERQELRAAHEQLMRDKFSGAADSAMDIEGDEEEEEEEQQEHNHAELQASFDQLRAMRYWQLTNEEHNQVDGILRGPDNHEVVIDKFNVEMTRNKMLCLKPFTWLNDEVLYLL